MAELVFTVLSQHTSDANSERAFNSLRRRFPTWEEAAAAPVEEIAAAIRAGGLAEQKAPRLKRILEEIERREGALTLDRLTSLEDARIADYLISLPGVGPKTAACVLAFSLGRPAFPVDTHVHRIAVRLGWVKRGATAEQVHRDLAPRIPPEIRYDLHAAFVRHGREVCRALTPRCGDCVLLDLCDSGPSYVAAGQAG